MFKKAPGALAFLFMTLSALPQPARAHGDGDEQPLTPEDIAYGTELCREQFRNQYGTWLLNRTTSLVTKLSEDGDELEVRIYYRWGYIKLARYFVHYELPGRLECERVFSGPGAL